MTQSMIERVTRVIELAIVRHGVDEGDLEGTLDDARAAIEAVLSCIESSEFMAAVSERAHDGRFSVSGETYPVPRNFIRAFFDAALNEEVSE